MRDVDAENFDELFFHAEAIDVFDFVPNMEADDEVDAFFAANAFDAEHGGDVDDADAANFHVVAGEFSAGADDFAAVDESDAGDVVADEAVAAFDERENAFAFADAAFAFDDDTDAEDIDHAAHFARARGEHEFEREGGEIDEAHGDVRRGEDGNVSFFSAMEELTIGLEISAENNARNFVAEKIGVALGTFGGREGLEIVTLGVAHDLDSFAGEVAFETSESKAGAVDGGFANDSTEAFGARDEIQAERAGMFGIKAFNRDDVALHGHGGHGIAAALRATGKTGDSRRALCDGFVALPLANAKEFASVGGWHRENESLIRGDGRQ